MSNTYTTWLMLAALSLNIVASQADGSDQADDQVVASFEREFSREAVPARDARRDDIDADVLYELVNKPLQSGESDDDAGDTLVAEARQ